MKHLKMAAARGALALVGAGTGALVGHAVLVANAGHGVGYANTFHEGTCDRIPTGYITCRTNYVRGSTMAVRDIPDFVDVNGEDWSSLYRQPLLNAEQLWTAADGPQWVSQTPEPDDTWNYIHVTTTKNDPQQQLVNGYAITYACNNTRPPGVLPCDPRGLGDTNLQWADIYVDDLTLPMLSSEQIQSTFAHELGHSLGLGHHDVGSDVDVMSTMGVFPPGPTSIDIGTNSECRTPNWNQSVAQYWGIRCIYDWYGYSKVPPGATPTRTAVPTATNTPTPTAVPTATDTPTSGGGNPCTGKC